MRYRFDIRHKFVAPTNFRRQGRLGGTGITSGATLGWKEGHSRGDSRVEQGVTAGATL